jgi:CarD family transcriptional regulator
LREVVPQKELPKIFKCLRAEGAPQQRETWNRRQRAFLEKIRSGDIFELAEVFRDLSYRGAQQPLSYGERQVLQATRKLLVEELSVAGGVSSGRIGRRVERLVTAKGGHAR